MSLIGLAPTFGVLLLLMLFAGISAAAFHVPAPVVVARAAGSRRGLGMSFFMVGGEAARAVGPMAAIGAVSLFGLDGFYPVMVVGLLCSVLLAWATRGLPVSSKKRQPIPMLKTWGDLQHILGPITGILVARGFMHGAMAGFLPTFIKMNTHNLVLAAVGLTIYESAGIVGVFTAGSLSDRIGRRRVLTLSLVGAPVFLLTFIWVDGWASYLFLVLTGLTLLSTTPVMLALVQDRAGDSPAAANGLFMMISFLARSAVVVLIGCVADLIGLRSTFIACAVLGFSSLFFIRRLPRD
jgi:MFS transporter, FSR family, fosmidomycin resistance protein